uniref:TLC domain-containing protein n=1 Tax=Anguilla anguilla TaxID=7936 RepID=A0A0E9T912_ANGAN
MGITSLLFRCFPVFPFPVVSLIYLNPNNWFQVIFVLRLFAAVWRCCVTAFWLHAVEDRAICPQKV